MPHGILMTILISTDDIIISHHRDLFLFLFSCFDCGLSGYVSRLDTLETWQIRIAEKEIIDSDSVV